MRVSSSAIKEVLYLHSVQALFVVWRQGKVSMYRDVPVEVSNEIKDSESKGEYFWNNIRDQYEWKYVIE